jgi:uncharacterized membrane protein
LTVFLWATVTVIVASTAVGAWMLWPGQTRAGSSAPGRLPSGSLHADPLDAVVVSAGRQACPGTLVPASTPPTGTTTPGTGSGDGGGATGPAIPSGPSVSNGPRGVPQGSSAADRAIDEALRLAAQEAGTGDDQSVPAGAQAPAAPDPGAPTPAPATHGSAIDGAPASSWPQPVTGGDDAGLVTDASCVMARVRLAAGPDTGRLVDIPVPSQVLAGRLTAGQRVMVARFPAEPGTAATYGWVDYSRTRPLSVLVVLFLASVLLVARWRGITALVGLGLGYATIAEFMLPALRAGRDPLAVALCGAVSIMVVILYVAHGVTAKTTTALLGTVFGLSAAAGLAWWASSAAQLNGLGTEDNLSLTTLPGVGLRGVILCGLILASLGVLNDVTVTQASAVWEIAAHAPHLGVRRLFASGMRVGRDHLASTIYTIAFAYAGTALPTLMLVDMFATPWLQVVTSGQIAEEIVRTLVGAIGLILAIPVTTLVAALIVAVGTRRTQPATTAGHPPADHPTPTPPATVPIAG